MSDSNKCPGHHDRDVAVQLKEQLQAIIGPDCEIRMIRNRPWASITFSGTRRRITIDCLSYCIDQLTQLKTDLPKHEFNLPGHFVADLLICENADMEAHQMLTLEILTIIDPATPGLG